MHLDDGRSGPQAIEELIGLATSAGARVADIVTGRLRQPNAHSFAGSGKVEEIREHVAACHADVVLVNHPLTPIQERNLEQAVCARVLDREGLILDIFAQRAASHEGKLQVELAQLQRLSTRLVRGWTHLERQKGGIGLRGPGETQLETDRRLIGARIRTLKERLKKLGRQRGQRRRTRRKVPIPTVSLVGYTNAGKSSLFNRLTESGTYVADQLFATLDPCMRRLELPGAGDVVLADTVGFIRELPHGLVEAFHSTLEEVSESALLLHVIDASDPERDEHSEQVEAVLAEIGAGSVPRIAVYNKIDATRYEPRWQRGGHGRPDRVWISVRDGRGLEELQQAIAAHFRARRSRHQVRVPARAGELRARIYERATILAETFEDDAWRMDLEMEPQAAGWLYTQAGEDLEILDPQAPEARLVG